MRGFKLIGLLSAAVLIAGCSPGAGGVTSSRASDWAPTAQLQGLIADIAEGCQEAGGSKSECACLADWFVFNTSSSEMAFSDAPPARGEWIYLGGNLFVPGEYARVFGECAK